MSKIIYTTCMKGGTCKTQISYMLSKILSDEPYNKRCITLSLDPQCDYDEAVGFFGKNRIGLYTIYDVLTAKCKIRDAIQHTKYNFDMILSDKRLVTADKTFVDADDYYAISDIITYLNDYDYIIIDSNRSRGFISTAIFYCCDYVIIPVLNDSGSINSITEIYNDISKLKNRDNSHAKILGFVLSKYENTNEHKDTNELLELIADKYNCKKFSHIRKSIAVDKSRNKHMSVDDFKKWDNASVDYRKFVKEITDEINRLEGVINE